jgi:glycosyltransferase involved in cell wall biosynthesis
LVSEIYRIPLVWLFRRSGSHVNFVSATNFLKESVRTVWGQPSDVIYPPVDVSHFTSLSLSGHPRTSRKIVSVARFVRAKNHMQQLDILIALLRINPGWSLAMVGSAKDSTSAEVLDELDDRIRKSGTEGAVKILTDATQSEVDRELATSEFFLHTNHKEGFGISIIEAAAAGCIPVVPRQGGAGEIVAEGLRFSNVEEAVNILVKLSTGWRPANSLVEGVAYGDEEFQRKWAELAQRR